MRWLVVITLLFGCVDDRRLSGPVFDVRVTRRNFELEVRRQVDIVMVVDNSSRVAAFRETLRSNIPNLANVLNTIQGGLPDVQVGFLTTDCNDGALLAASENGRFLVDTKRTDGTRMTNYEGDLGAAMLASFDALPPSSCTLHQPLATLVRSLEHPANAGFMRADADLMIVILSANDDESERSVEELASTIKAHKRTDSSVMVGAAIGPCRQADPSLSADPARRLRAFLAQFPNRSTASVLCQEDLSSVMQLQGELLQVKWTGNPCFDVEIPDPPECVTSVNLDEEQLVPPCEIDRSGLCWRIEVDASQCPGASHQRVVIDNYTPTARRVPAIIECVVPSPGML